MAENIIGLFKTKVINFFGPWKSMAQVGRVVSRRWWKFEGGVISG
jgi:hypothetical protein